MRRPEQWRERSRTCLRAAKLLLANDLLRDSISRSYYAAYSAATSALIGRRIRFARGWQNPSHEQLPELISSNTALRPNARVRINRLLRFLRQARENADYRPASYADHLLAINCIHSATEIMQHLEIEHEQPDQRTGRAKSP